MYIVGSFLSPPLPLPEPGFASIPSLLLSIISLRGCNFLIEFVVNITEQKGQHDIPRETIQALDMVLRESVSKPGRDVIGRSMFCAEFGKGSLGDGIEFWTGLYQSLRPTQMALSLNIDMSDRAFYESILVPDFVREFLNEDISRPLTDQGRIREYTSVKSFCLTC